MNNNRGFTLIELIIATTIILIVSLGFFGWASTIIQTNLSIERNNTAYAMAMEVAEELQRMPDNSLIQPKSGNEKYVGYAATDLDSDGVTNELNGCSGSNPSVNLDPASTPGMTIYTDPWKSTAPQSLYLYDNNACATTSWDTDSCRTGSTITSSANTSIDHPNSTAVTTYDTINPIRSYRNTTYYAVWSVAYIPCGTTSTDRRKIFVTVYWIDPEPTAALADVVTGIGTTYKIKSVSIAVDKAIGTES